MRLRLGDLFRHPAARRAARALALTAGLCSAFAGGPAAGAESAAPSSKPLTLDEAEQLAFIRNADWRVAQTQVEAALAQLKAAREFPNPTLGLSTGKINTDGRSNATALGNGLLDRSYDSIVSLSQLFELGGKRALRHASAEAGVHAAEALRDDTRRLLLQSVIQTYVAALTAREQVTILTQSAASLLREADIAGHRLSAGDIAASDQAQIEIAADQLELNANAARAAARTAVVTLETLLGERHPAGTTALADTLDLFASKPALDADAPQGMRPDIVAAEAVVARAEADLRFQKRANVPDVTLSVQYERQPPDQPNTAGLALSIPIPLWNHNAGGILGARAALDQAQAQLDKTRIQASADVATARIAFREATDRVHRFHEILRPKSARITQTVTFAYEKGGSSLLELLAAQRADNDIRLATIQAEADSASAEAALAAALGRLTTTATAPSQP
jgi:cobalt-zinc-cadmium efflux system outer membrane protein